MLTSLINLIFPKVCFTCDAVLYQGEAEICTRCRHDLPLCNWPSSKENLITDKLKGRVDLHHADALLYFEKRNKTQHLIHELKYKNQKQISSFLGQWHASKLRHDEWTKTIDVITPVPIHARRLRQRGYNQVRDYALEISKTLGCHFDDNLLKRNHYSRTQVFKSRILRTDVIEHNFALHQAESYEGKHIVLADDLITTGSTAEACFIELSRLTKVKLSLLVMAVA